MDLFLYDNGLRHETVNHSKSVHCYTNFVETIDDTETNSGPLFTMSKMVHVTSHQVNINHEQTAEIQCTIIT